MAQPQRRDAAKKVLAVENLTAKVLGQSIDQVAKRAAASHMAPHYAALVVQATAALAITKAHEAARGKAADVFEAQTGLDAAEDDGEPNDRAQQAATGLAKAFRENVAEHLVAGLGAQAAYVAAMRDLRPNIERTATTEVMAAWNGETRRQARAASVEVTQTWNAELDACDACSAFGGMTIRADEVFPDGDPPLHPRCRCAVDSKVVRVPEESETRVRVAEPVAAPKAEPVDRSALWAKREREAETAIAAERQRFTAARARAEEAKRLAAEAEAKAAAATPARTRKQKPVPFEQLPLTTKPSDPTAFAGMTDTEFADRAGEIAARFSGAQRQAIREFTGSAYGNIRRVQRLSETAAVKMYGRKEYRAYQSAIEHLDALHTAENAAPGIVWRGLADVPDKAFNRLLAQDDVTFIGTSSTTRAPSQTGQFMISGKNTVLLKIHQSTAVPVEAVGIDYERELLVKDGTKFRVLSRTRLEIRRDQRTLLLEIEEVP